MTLEKCNKCKMIKNCDLYVPMKQMAAELERDLKEEKMFSRRFI